MKTVQFLARARSRIEEGFAGVLAGSTGAGSRGVEDAEEGLAEEGVLLAGFEFDERWSDDPGAFRGEGDGVEEEAGTFGRRGRASWVIRKLLLTERFP